MTVGVFSCIFRESQYHLTRKPLWTIAPVPWDSSSRMPSSCSSSNRYTNTHILISPILLHGKNNFCGSTCSSLTAVWTCWTQEKVSVTSLRRRSTWVNMQVSQQWGVTYWTGLLALKHGVKWNRPCINIICILHKPSLNKVIFTLWFGFGRNIVLTHILNSDNFCYDIILI